MEWLEDLFDLLASREWLLLMVVCIAGAAFMFPDYRLMEKPTEADSAKDGSGDETSG